MTLTQDFKETIRESETPDNPAVAVLCKAIRDGELCPTVLFQRHATARILAVGDIINVARTRSHRSHLGVIVTGVLMRNDELCYVTLAGGPFHHTHCTLVEKAGTTVETCTIRQPAPGEKEIAAVTALVKREFKSYMGRGRRVTEFLKGSVPLSYVFSGRSACDYEDGSREYEMGECLAGALEDHYDIGLSEELEISLTDDVQPLHVDALVLWLIARVRAEENAMSNAEDTTHGIDDSSEPVASGEYFDTKKPNKKESGTFDNSHNHGFRGRINQRRIDSEQ